ncbi:MAG: hypothetical protein HYS25_09560 [Ignavibacteriales bacterium]|nr:hypothetical protein [Ignavibacteriales bacterium]
MKKNIIVVLVVLLTAVLTNAQDKIKEAETALKQKDYDKALGIAKELLDSGSVNDASKVLIQLQQINSSDKKVFEYLGDAYAKMNVGELAITNYEEAEALDSTNVELKFKTAQLLYKQKRYKDAVNKYLKIISFDLQNAKAYLEGAQILYLAKLYSDAALMYEKYLALDQTKDAYQKITKALLEIKNYDKAFSFSTDGLSKYPGDLAVTKNAAVSAYALKKFEDAAKYYSALPDSQLTTNDLVNAARSFQQSKSDSLALIYFEKAVNQDSSLSSIYMDIANYNYLNKNYDAAVKYYNAKIKSDSTFEPAYRFMAFALMQQKNYEATRAAFLKAVALNDTLVPTKFWLAQTYRQLDSLSQAADQYQKMLDVIGNSDQQFKNECAEAYGFLGQRAFERKNYGGAVGYLRKAVVQKSDVLGYKVMLASSLHQNGNIDEAISWYKRILAIDSKNEVAKKGLRMLSAD